MGHISLPKLPEPVANGEDLGRWTSDIKRELERFIDQTHIAGTDNQLTGRVEDQVISDNFTILPNSPKIGVISTKEVMSSSIVAIKAGRNGQTVEIHNQNSFNITLKDKALIRCVGDQDLIMFPNDVVQFHWDIQQEKWMQIGTAGVPSVAQISEIASPIAAQAAAQAVLGVIPTGCIIAFMGIIAPTGFLMCDGSLQSRTAFANLFSVIGTLFGSSSDSDFKLPSMGGLLPRGAGGDIVLGERGGTDVTRITLVSENLPPHTHAYDRPGANINVETPVSPIAVSGPRIPGTASDNGPGTSAPVDISVINPFLAVNYIIKT